MKCPIESAETPSKAALPRLQKASATRPSLELDGYTMQVAARRSGVSPHLIRMWERRYNAVEPRRTVSGRRVYSDEAIEKLRLLHAATQAGHSISSVAQLPLERLRLIVRADAQAPSQVARNAAHFSPSGARSNECPANFWVEKALDAIKNLDASALRGELNESLVALGRVAVIDQVIAPLMERVGAMWRSGELRVVHEHLAAAGARSFLGSFCELPAPMGAPLLMATTLPGQMHEIGALMVAATAASEGWRALYAGANLPAEEIVLAMRAHEGCRVIALSFIFPPDDPNVAAEVRRLGEFLPTGVQVLAGGRAAENYAEPLNSIGARRVANLRELRSTLEELRA